MNKRRCRFCFGVLITPQCSYCQGTHEQANRIASGAVAVYRSRGQIFDEVMVEKLKTQSAIEEAAKEVENAEV